MKNVFLKFGIFAAYIVLLAWILGFKLGLIINLPMLAVVITGTSLLTLLNRMKGISGKELVDKVKWNLLVTGYMTTFLAQVSLFSGKVDIGNISAGILRNFLPLFYAFLFYLAADVFGSKAAPRETPAPLPETDDVDLLEGLDLSKREMMVAKEMLKDISNKEIGEILFISENTVKKHVQNILKKANVKNRTEFINAVGGGSAERKDHSI